MGKEKKEIGKLIELLNEREKTVNGVQHPGRCKEHLEYQCHGPRVINKRFGFIKRLVEKDKIDTESYCRITSIERKREKDVFRDEVDSLLMLLAIQDEPIRFLCEILK